LKVKNLEQKKRRYLKDASSFYAILIL